jgi:predicted secreted hydrolase
MMRRRDFLRLAALLSAGGLPALSPGAARAGESAAAGTGSDGGGAIAFPPVLPGRRLHFPEDHGAHPDYRVEWWYATGWLDADPAPTGAAGEGADPRAATPLGFQVTFFRVRSGIGEDNPSRFAPTQLILAHAAIADPAQGRLRHAERAARASRSETAGRAGFVTERTAVWVGDWRFEQSGDRYRATVRAEDFACALELRPTSPPLLNGDAGFSQKAADPRHASYYYSRPQLAVTGSLTLGGTPRAVRGHGWLDHEWSSELLPPGAQGWDWIGINLDGGGALMAFRMRTALGEALWAAATLDTGGAARALPPTEVRFEPLDSWRSPRTSIVYPIAWRLGIDDRVFELRALMPDQELDSRRSTGAIYWEGAVRLYEAGREIGRGYLEMTGYGERIRVG